MKYNILLHRFIQLSVCVFLLASHSVLHAQWTQSNGPTGGVCNVLIENSGVLYAGTTTAGVMKSTDSARTWVAVNNGLTDVMIYSLVFKGTVLYAGTPGGLYSSNNGGNSWSTVTAFPTLPAYSLATNGTKLFAGTPNGMYVSINNGASWTNPLSQKPISTIRIIGTSVFAGTTYDYLYKSADTGSTWTRISNNNGLNSNVINTITNVGTTLFVGTGGTGSNTGIYRSVDNGSNWVQITEPLWDVRTMISVGSTLYAGGSWLGLYYSKNNGTTWNYSGCYSIFISSMVNLGSKIFVGYDSVAYADTSYLLNYKAAALTSPGNNATNSSKYPLFQWVPNFKAGNVYFQYSTSPTNWSDNNLTFVTVGTTPPTSHTLPFALNYSTKYYWRILESAWDVVDTSAPLIIVSDTFSFTTGAPQTQKHVLLEYATTVNVGFCPRGETALLNTLSKYSGDVLGVSIHNDYGSGFDSMRVSTTSDFFSSYILAYPNMTVDRKRFPAVSQGFSIVDPLIGGPISDQLSTTPPVNVQLNNSTFYKSSRTLSTDVSADFIATTTGDMRLNLYIVEDSVQGTGAGYDQINNFSKTGATPDSTSPWYNFPPVITNHYHRHVLRSMLGGTWGDGGIIPATAIAGKSYSKNYTFTIPPTWNENRIRVIGIVQKYDSSNLDNREILNAAQATPSSVTLALTYPNGGQILAAGDSATFTWQGAAATDSVLVSLTIDGIAYDTITTAGIGGQFIMKLPKVESSKCKVSVSLGKDRDTSDRFFTISIPKGSATTIDFGLTSVGTSLQKTSLCLSTGIALLKVQEVLFQTGTHFYLKGLTRKNDSTYIDIVFDPKSVGSFTDIVYITTQAGDTINAQVTGDAKAAEKLIITYPNGNELLTAKDTLNIRWTGVASTDTVVLESSVDAGATWQVITKNATGNTYLWTLPKIEADKCLIRATAGISNKPGDIDTNFKIGQGIIGGGVNCGSKQKDGKLLFGGDFLEYDLHSSPKIVRLLADGTYDTSFQIGDGIDGAVHSIVQQADGKILVAGDFSLFNTIPVKNIVRLNSDGSIDPTFTVTTGVNAQINSIALQPDNKIVVIGQFTQFDTTTANRILRLNPDGTLDNTFQSGTGFNTTVDALLIDNGYIYVCGQADTYNGISGKNTYRLKSDGSNDTTYKVQKGFTNWVQYGSIQPDKKLLYSGGFDGYDGYNSRNIARLNTDGTVDTTFLSGLSPTADKVYGTTIQSDGKIYATGSFTSYDNVQLSNFVRMFPDGKYDPDFQTGSGFNAKTLGSIISDNNHIIVYGLFSTYNNKSCPRIVQLFTQFISTPADSTDAFFAISIPKGVSTTLDFGKADTATNTSKDFIITNTGKVPLALTMLQNSNGNPFSTQDTAKRVIAVGKDDVIMMSFIPTAVTTYTDTMKWVTIAGDTIVSTMTGEGIASKPGVNANFTVNSISLCQYTDSLLSVKITGGTPPFQFAWTNKDGTAIISTDILNGGTQTDSTIRLSPSATNTYRVIVTDSKSESDTAFVDMIVKNRPTPKLFLKGSTTICEGDSTLIEVVNEVNYTGAPLWSDGSISATLWVKSSGVYFCAIDSNGCIGVSDSVTITVNSKPSVSITQTGDELVSTTADAYQWLDNSTAEIVGATAQRFSPISESTYSVRITKNGCTATSAPFIFKKRQNLSSIIVFDLNFGQQVVSNIIGRNAPLRNSIKIFNGGTVNRTIDSIHIGNSVFDLKKSSLPRLVPPGAIASFNIDFTPLAIGQYSDSIVVYASPEIIVATIKGEGIALPPDGVITEVELVPNKLEVSPGDTLFVYLRIKDEQPQASKATKFIANMQYDSRVLQWLPRSRQYNDEDSKRTNYWSLNVQEKRRSQGNPALDTLMFWVKLADVDSTSLIFSDSTAFIWTDANGKVFPACRDSIVYIKICKDGGISQLIKFAKPDEIKQVAPNPSIGNSTITLSMGIPGQCSVSLIDIFGREIQKVDYSHLPEGDHTLQFDNAMLETGTYYVVMKTGFNVSSQKISIVK